MSGTRLLWLRSIRHRFAAAAGLFVIVAAATASAVAGPLLIRAAQQSGLRSELSREPPGALDISVSAAAGSQAMPDSNIDGALVDAARAAGTTLFYPPLGSVHSTAQVRWTQSKTSGTGRAIVLDNGCASLVLVSGTCPKVQRDVLLPADPAKAAPRVGRPISFPGRKTYGPYVVRGYYSTTDPVASTLGSRSAHPPLFVTRLGLQLLTANTTFTARARFRAGVLGLDQLAVARQRVRDVQAGVLQAQLATAADSGLPALVDRLHAQARIATVLGLLIAVPVVLLSWYAVVLIMQLIALVRAPEWALGRLRGLPLTNWIRSLYAEPAAVLIAGALVGVALGLSVSWLTIRETMFAGTTVELLRPPVLIAVIGTVVGAAIGIGLGTARGIRLPLAALLQESAEPVRITRLGAAAQVLLVAAAILAGFQLRTQSQLSVSAANLGLLLPALLAMILSLLVIRLGTRLVRRSSGSPPRSVTSLVLGRRLARNPGTLWRHSVIAVAMAVVVFAVQLIVLMSRNVSLRSGNLVGADRVLHVRRVPTTKLLAAVRASDPGGRHAMAVEEVAGSGAGGTSRLIAVDSGRLAAVSDWHAAWAGLNAAHLGRLLAPPHRAPVVLRGTSVRVTLSDVSIAVTADSGLPLNKLPTLQVVLIVQSGSSWQQISLGSLIPRTHTLSAAIDCARGCVLRQLQFQNSTDITFTSQVSITSLSTDRQPATDFSRLLRDPRNWQAGLMLAQTGLPVTATSGLADGGLGVDLRDLTGHGDPTLLPADGPSAVPTVLAKATVSSPIGGLRHVVGGNGLDGQALAFRVLARAVALPRSVDDGALVDLTSIARLSDPSHSTATDEVWLAPGASAGLLAALHRHGLVITGTERTSTARHLLAAASPVRAVTANTAVVVLLGVLAASALAAGIAVDSSRRRQHVRVLRDVGFSEPDIGRSIVQELAFPLVAAVLIGAVAALVSLLLAGARLPLFADAVGPPLATEPDWRSFAVTIVAALAIVLAAAVVLAWRERRLR